MIYTTTPKEIEQRRKVFLRKWRLKCQLSPTAWKRPARASSMKNAHEEFKRRIKTQTVLPSAETAAMLF